MKITQLAVFLMLLIQFKSYSQTDSSSKIQLSAYAEFYYTQDFRKNTTHNRPDFMYSHSRTDELNLNLLAAKLAYVEDNVRAHVALAWGTYMQTNYASEPTVLQHILEANAGVKLSKTHNLWLDVGVLPSHIGLESAIGKDNWTLSRSLFAENSPYFETGAKLTYSSLSEKWTAAVLLLNGWQRIQREEGNNKLAFGHQLTYKASDHFLINSSSFVGQEGADSVGKQRYFHNLYGQFNGNKNWGLSLGFDIGLQQKEKSSNTYNCWYTPVLLVQYRTAKKVNLAARAEYYQDKQGVLIHSGSPEGFQTFGYSVNVDYTIVPSLLWRTEFRNLRNKDPMFIQSDQSLSNQYTSLMTALIFSIH